MCSLIEKLASFKINTISTFFVSKNENYNNGEQKEL